MTYEGCKGIIGNNACRKMDKVLRNKDSSDLKWQIRRVAEIREELEGIFKRR